MNRLQALITQFISYERKTGGTETSKYPEEEKEKFDFLSSGERKGKSPNHTCMGLRTWQRMYEWVVKESWEAPRHKVIVL